MKQPIILCLSFIIFYSQLAFCQARNDKQEIIELKRDSCQAIFKYIKNTKEYLIVFKDIKHSDEDSLNIYVVKGEKKTRVFRKKIEILDTLNLKFYKKNEDFILIETARNQPIKYLLLITSKVKLTRIN